MDVALYHDVFGIAGPIILAIGMLVVAILSDWSGS